LLIRDQGRNEMLKQSITTLYNEYMKSSGQCLKLVKCH
jgi:hypothetical protein